MKTAGIQKSLSHHVVSLSVICLIYNLFQVKTAEVSFMLHLQMREVSIHVKKTIVGYANIITDKPSNSYITNSAACGDAVISHWCNSFLCCSHGCKSHERWTSCSQQENTKPQGSLALSTYSMLRSTVVTILTEVDILEKRNLRSFSLAIFPSMCFYAHFEVSHRKRSMKHLTHMTMIMCLGFPGYSHKVRKTQPQSRPRSTQI